MPAKGRKVVVLGYRCVGKTSLVGRFVTGEFNNVYSPTIENNFSAVVSADRKHQYNLQILDTSGQDELSLLPSSYVFNVEAYILVYSVTSMSSFNTVQSIYQQLATAGGLLPGRFPVVLVANKIDAIAADADVQREVSTDAGCALATLWRASYVETSAALDLNVSRMFDLLAQRLKDADDGKYLMSTFGVVRRKPPWWKRLMCATPDSLP